MVFLPPMNFFSRIDANVEVVEEQIVVGAIAAYSPRRMSARVGGCVSCRDCRAYSVTAPIRSVRTQTNSLRETVTRPA